MKKLLTIFLCIIYINVAFAQKTEVYYTCVMHPQIHKSQPGNCPICGMTLVKKTVRVKQPATKTLVKKTVQPKKVPAKVSAKVATQKKPTVTTKKSEVPAGDQKVIYTCVMHPQVQQDKPGKCPICGMTLVKKTIPSKTDVPHEQPAREKTGAPGTDVNKQQERKTKEIYTCVMHPQVQQDKPGKCPICGMTLVKKTIPVNTEVPQQQPAGDKAGVPVTDVNKQQEKKTKEIYTCVMHPQVQQDKPGKCPICGMTLVKKTIPVESEQPHSQVTTAGDNNVTINKKINISPGKTVVYHLYVTDTMVNFTGKRKHAYAVNGSIPSPTLIFTEGDTAEIYLHNMLKNEETSFHWHGVILPNAADGVPHLTTAPVKAGETHLYKFPVVQNGTYWYHSHTALQEQNGMYGNLIFKKRQENSPESSASTRQLSVVLSEWADENPMQIQRRLRTANDWFSIKKGSTQSYSEAIAAGQFKTKLVNEWKRMKAMDVSDVFYDKFLVNGKPEQSISELKAGDKITLHLTNAGASTYFWLQYAGGKITVVGNDGNDQAPVEVDRLIVAPAETYDLQLTVPQDMSYELRATSEDRTGASSLWLGSGMKMPAFKLPKLKYFEGMKMMNQMMRTNGTMKDMGMNMSLQQMDMNMVMYPEVTGESTGKDHMQMNHNGMEGMNMNVPTGGDIVTLNYGMMRSPVMTALPDESMRILHFTLTGNMNRYIWTMDNKTVNEADKVMINKGENLRVILTNNSMMRHPMHLHGHDFRVVNPQGDYAPLKNVIDVMPMETDTIEFAANQDGNWFFHCHILYHMMAGMGRVFRYENSAPNPELPDTEMAYKMFKRHNNMYHLTARVGLESNGSDGEAILSSNRYALNGLWHLGIKPEYGYEGELSFGRYLGVNQWLFPYVGFDYHYKKLTEADGEGKNLLGQQSNKSNRKTFTVGLQYITPLLFLADARVDGNGKLRFQLSREDIPVTSRLRFNIMGNTDKEYAAGLRYIVSKWFAISSHYDSDMGLGAGITITY